MVNRYFPCLPQPTVIFPISASSSLSSSTLGLVHAMPRLYTKFHPQPPFFLLLFFILKQIFIKLCRLVLNSLCLQPKQALAPMSLAVLPGLVTIFLNIKIVTRNSIFCLSYTQRGMADSCLKICLETNKWFCHVWYKSVLSSSLPLADIFFFSPQKTHVHKHA